MQGLHGTAQPRGRGVESADKTARTGAYRAAKKAVACRPLDWTNCLCWAGPGAACRFQDQGLSSGTARVCGKMERIRIGERD